MEFANSLYASVTRQFFDFLVTNVNAKFIDRCVEVGEQEYSHELDRSEDVTPQSIQKEPLQEINSTDPTVDEDQEIWNFQSRSTQFKRGDQSYSDAINNSVNLLAKKGFISEAQADFITNF